MSDLNQLIEIIKTIRLKINDDTDLIYSGFEDFKELQNEIDSNLNEIINGDIDKLSVFEIHFLPTATFQELSMANGWTEEYHILAKRFDELYYEITNKKNQKTTRSIINAGFWFKIKLLLKSILTK